MVSSPFALQVQLPVVASWGEDSPAASTDLHKLAEAVLYVESMVASLERGERRAVGVDAEAPCLQRGLLCIARDFEAGGKSGSETTTAAPVAGAAVVSSGSKF